MLDAYLNSILNEAIIRPEEVDFGSNIGYYDDDKIGYHGVSRSFFVVTKVSEEEYLSVSISRQDGMIRFTLTKNAYIGRMLHLPSMYRQQALRHAMKHMGKVLYLIGVILKRYHVRFDTLRMTASFALMDRMLTFLIRSPVFKTMLRKVRYRTFNRRVVEEDDKKYILYEFTKDDESP